MKKTLLALILVLVFVLSFTLCVSAADNESTDTEGDIILGDVDGDGKVTNADVLMIYRYIYNPELYPLPTVCQHEFGNWQMTKQATCAEDGVIIGTCIYCSKTEEVVIPRTEAHVEVIDEAVAPTCTETGLTEGKHCSVCNVMIVEQNVIDTNGHTEVTDEAIAPTCTENGLTEGSHCNICNKTIVAQHVIKATGHTPGEKITDIPETCSNDGTYHIECTVCGKALEEGTIIGGHIYKDTVVAPTPAEQGYTTHTCERCGDSFDDNFVPALGTAGLEFYPLTDGTYGVMAGTTKYLDTIIIPSTHNGMAVTQILSDGFKEMVNLETVVIPDSVNVIGENAFSGCSKLANLALPNSIVHFGTNAFSDCKNLNGTFIISSKCNYVGNNCFAKCYNIEVIIIPDSLEYIGAYAFSNVASLTWQSEQITTWNRTVNGTFNSYSSPYYDASFHSVTGTYELSTATLSATTAEDKLSGTAEEKWVKVGSRYFSYVYYRACTWTRVIE